MSETYKEQVKTMFEMLEKLYRQDFESCVDKNEFLFNFSLENQIMLIQLINSLKLSGVIKVVSIDDDDELDQIFKEKGNDTIH